MINASKVSGILARFQKLAPREKLVFYGAVILVSLAVTDRLIVRSFTGILGGLDKQIQEKESRIKAGLRVVAQKDRIEIQRTNYKPYLGSSQNENEEFTSILKGLDSIAPAQPGFNLVDMKPAGVKESAQAKKYMVALNCEGTMEKIAEFMYNVETAKRLFTIEKYEITPKSKDTNLAKCSMTISSLVLP